MQSDQPTSRSSVNALSSILLGGVRAATLREAGLVAPTTMRPSRWTRSFASPRTPYLSLWY